MRPRLSRSMPFDGAPGDPEGAGEVGVEHVGEGRPSDHRRSSVSLVMPALATSTSTGPCSASTSSKAASTVGRVGDVAAHAEQPSGGSPER